MHASIIRVLLIRITIVSLIIWHRKRKTRMYMFVCICLAEKVNIWLSSVWVQLLSDTYLNYFSLDTTSLRKKQNTMSRTSIVYSTVLIIFLINTFGQGLPIRVQHHFYGFFNVNNELTWDSTKKWMNEWTNIRHEDIKL